jgi:lysophospholipase L1-like esterase
MVNAVPAGEARDIRVCFVGDSYVAGVGDTTGLGWVGRLCAHAHASGLPITGYNLGVRRDTSADVATRLPDEVGRRVSPGAELRVVLAYGLNDVVLENGHPPIAAADSLEATSRSFAWLKSAGIPVIFAGPPPIGDPDQDFRTGELDRLFAGCAASHGIRYVSVFGRLTENQAWLSGVREGDGAHPGPAGYQQYFEAVREPLTGFLAGESG